MEALALALGLLGAAGVAAFVARYSDRAFIRRILGNASTTPIASIVDGATAKIVGRVGELEGHHLTAAISGRRCVHYELVMRWTTHSLFRHRKAHQLRERWGVMCSVEDGTGTALLDLSRAEVTVEDKLVRHEKLADLPEICSHAFARKGYSPAAFAHDEFEVIERALVVGAEVAAGGRAVATPSASGQPAGYRQPPVQITLRHFPRRPLFVSDDPRARHSPQGTGTA